MSDKEIYSEPLNTDKTVGVEWSEGGVNSFYHDCDVYQGRTNFAVCLHTINAIKAKTRHSRDCCTNAVTLGTCPALAMRQQELSAGHAIFFKNRADRVKELAAMNANQPSYRYGGGGRASTSRTSREPVAMREKPAAAPKPSSGLDISILNKNLTADAINAAVAKE